jgi:excisionase family DNA binding protein
MFENYPDVVNVKDLCEMLLVSKRSAYALIKSGELPAKRIGRLYRIRKADVIDFLTAC